MEVFFFIVVNQSDHEDKQTNQITPPSPQTSTTRKSVDDLLLLDLDPLNNVENHSNDTDEDKLERFKQDLEELYAQSTVIDTPLVTTPILPDIIGQQEELASTSIPLAVEQLEIEVRQEILQHTLEQPSPTVLLPDVTTSASANHDEENRETILVSNPPTEEEENLSSTPVIDTMETLNSFVFQNEPDLIQHETTQTPTPTQPPAVLHSVDSIVNLPNVADLKVTENLISFIQINLVR